MTVVDTDAVGTEKAGVPSATPAPWEELVHSMRDIVYVLNPDGTYQDVNAQMTRVLRRPRQQIIGQHFTVHLDKEHAAMAERILKEMLAHHNTERSSRIFTVPGAEAQYYEIIEVPLIRNGDVWAIAGVGRDISQEATLEHKLWNSVDSQRHSLDFAMRTSLGLVKGYIYTLGQNEALSDERRIRYTEIIEEEMDRLSKIIDDLLDFRRMENGKYEFSEQIIHLPECVEMVLRQFEEEASRRSIELVAEMPDHMDPLYLFSDAVNRVLTNLVQNAIHHTLHSGKIVISVQDSDLYVDISVKDNGSGIPEEDMPYIFEKYYRGKSTENQPNQGIGMGLAIVKTLVTAMGGKVWAVSSNGAGSEFRVVLPRRLYSIADNEDSTRTAIAVRDGATFRG